MVDYTTNYNLELIDFNKIPWHEREHGNWRTIDAIFANFITINSMQGVWQNAIAVTVGQRYVDPELGTIWTVAVAHTTASTGTFATDRTTNTTYWTLFSDVALAESWATSLSGLVNLTDYSSKAYAIGSITENPNGSAKYWQALSAADAVSTAADAVSTAADAVSTAADVVSTNADVVTTNADAATTTQDAIDTAADVVLTNADVVTAGNSATAAAASAVAAAAAAAANLYSTIVNATGTVTPNLTTDDGTLYVCDTSGGAVTVNLPAIGTSEGIRYGFINGSGTNDVTINRNGSDTINGATSITLTDDTQFTTIVSDDNSPDNWVTLSGSTITAGNGLSKTGETLSLDLTNSQTWTGDQTFGPITETQTTKATSFTPSLTAEGTVYNCNAAITITMPSAEAGKGFTIIHDDGTEITWAGTILWADSTVPTATANKQIYVFLSDGTNWLGSLVGSNYGAP